MDSACQGVLHLKLLKKKLFWESEDKQSEDKCAPGELTSV